MSKVLVTLEQFKRDMIATAKGEAKAPSYAGKTVKLVPQAITDLLTDDNRSLLRTIDEMPPTSMTELAERTDRALSNLSRTLKKMESVGLVRMRKEGTRVWPELVSKRIQLTVDVLGKGPDLVTFMKAAPGSRRSFQIKGKRRSVPVGGRRS